VSDQSPPPSLVGAQVLAEGELWRMWPYAAAAAVAIVVIVGTSSPADGSVASQVGAGALALAFFAFVPAIMWPAGRRVLLATSTHLVMARRRGWGRGPRPERWAAWADLTSVSVRCTSGWALLSRVGNQTWVAPLPGSAVQPQDESSGMRDILLAEVMSHRVAARVREVAGSHDVPVTIT
jgi:hypothetical protein